MAALFYIIFGEGLILMGIYKPRRTRAINAASGNGAKPNPNIHPSQGNTNIPTTPGNSTTALNPGAVTPGNNIGNQPLNPGNQLANPNSSKNALQNIKRTIYSQNNLGKPFHDATVQEMDAKGAHITDHINVDNLHIQARANPPEGHQPPPLMPAAFLVVRQGKRLSMARILPKTSSKTLCARRRILLFTTC